MFKKYLLLAKKNNIPICVYSDKDDTDKFSFGLISLISENQILLNSISPQGLYDGYIIKQIEDIYRIEYGDNYGKRIYKLYNLRNQKHNIINFHNKNLIIDLLYFSQKNELCISSELCASNLNDVQGFVQDIVKDNLVVINQIDEDGNSNGTTIVDVNDITNLTCDSDTAQALKLLANHRTNNL